jgi:nitrous oxidase accessory protein NosD
MKSLSLLVLLMMMVIAPFQFTIPLGVEKSTVITLTANQVTSAIDIETAEHQVTREGTRPGVILLDGRDGPFIYTGIDRSINIFFSNVTLRGVNGATFPDTDGIYVDDVKSDHLVIENLAMNCSGDCLGMVGTHNHVTIRHNLFKTGAMGVGINRGKNWLITDNTIMARANGIFLIRTQNAVVTHNHVCAKLGVVLEGARSSTIQDNALSSGCLDPGEAMWQGVLLNAEARDNRVVGNSMLAMQQAGISLEPGVVGNTLRGNDVLCAIEAACRTVDAQPAEVQANTIQGNRP